MSLELTTADTKKNREFEVTFGKYLNELKIKDPNNMMLKEINYCLYSLPFYSVILHGRWCKITKQQISINQISCTYVTKLNLVKRVEFSDILSCKKLLRIY